MLNFTSTVVIGFYLMISGQTIDGSTLKISVEEPFSTADACVDAVRYIDLSSFSGAINFSCSEKTKIDKPLP